MDYQFLIFGLVFGALIVYIINIYNRFAYLRNLCENDFQQIKVQLQRRYDLIPNLVETTKKYLQHEQETLTKVIQARKGALEALQKQDLSQLSQLNQELNRGLMQIFATVEAYPELKANEEIRVLNEELSSTENRIAFARQNFNETVNIYNTYLETFPQNILAGLFKQQRREFLYISEENLTPPKVEM